MAEQQETPEHCQPGLLQVLREITDNSQRLMQGIAHRRCAINGAAASDPLHLGPTILELSARVLADPALVLQAQLALWQDHLRLWQNTGQRLLGQPVEPMIEPEQSDRRFRDPAWDDHAVFDFIKQSYLLTSRWLVDTVNQLEGFDDKTRRKIDFYTRQFVDAMAPSNFVATNPEVLRATLESRGANLLHGLNHLLEDLARGEGRLAIRMTDLEAFEVGGNLALSPGKVIYQNDLMQLLQYAPSTEQVYQRPLLVIPPWINKYYILDLRPKNSFIKYAVDQGFTVFVISWVNPDATPRRQDLRGLHGRGPAGGAGGDRAGYRRARSDRDRLLSGGHAARLHARLSRGEDASGASPPQASSRRSPTSRTPASSGYSSTRNSSPPWTRRWPGAVSSKAARWPPPSTCCAPTT